MAGTHGLLYYAEVIVNYDEPRQKADGKWHFTTMNDKVIRPIGNCAEECEGHATADEAREHYRDYVLDRARFGVEMQRAMKCRECGEDTHLAATFFPMGIAPLCGDHHEKEYLRPYVGFDSMHS